MGIVLELTKRPRSAQLTGSGELDLAWYGSLRDGLLKVAAESPTRLIADVNALVIDELAPSTVFPFVAKRVAEWPGVPFAVVTRKQRHLASFHRHGVARFVDIRASVGEAETSQAAPVRRTARRVLPRTDSATTLARAFVREHAVRWGVPEVIDGGTLAAGELVRNAIQHTSSEPELRLDLRRQLLSVAVGDDSDRPAVLLERADARDPGLGLRIVADAARASGSSRCWSGGKIVWAVVTSRAQDGRTTS